MRKLKNRKDLKEPNALVRWGEDKARRTRAEERGEKMKKGEDSSKTGRATIISGPTVCFPDTGFGDGVKRECGTGHIQVFFYGSVFLSAWV